MGEGEEKRNKNTNICSAAITLVLRVLEGKDGERRESWRTGCAGGEMEGLQDVLWAAEPSAC